MTTVVWGRKSRVLVDLVLLDGNVVRGKVFVAADERLIDAVTHDSPFLRFVTEDDEFEVVNKSLISRVQPIEQDEPAMVPSRQHRGPVELVRFDGTVVRGMLFLGERIRVSDVMNNDKMFFPFETEDGKFEIVNKGGIARAKSLEEEQTALTEMGGPLY